MREEEGYEDIGKCDSDEEETIVEVPQSSSGLRTGKGNELGLWVACEIW